MQDFDDRLPSFDAAIAGLPCVPAHGVASDEGFWGAVRDLYATSRTLTNLENGYWGPMAEPVRAMFQHWTERTNHENTLLIRDHWPRALEFLRETVAAALRLRRHPNTRLVLLTHLSHCTGLVMPVRELAALARTAGAEVIVDAAHSWGQLDFDVGSLDAAYVAFNLHKWIGAPIGCGCLYIRGGSLSAIDPYFGDRDFPATDVRSRIHTGSPNFGAWLTIPAALQLHQRISARAKEMRLRSLRNYWTVRARALRGIEMLTPDDPSMVAESRHFASEGGRHPRRTTPSLQRGETRMVCLTVRRSGPARGDVVRVTPAIYTSHADLDRLLAGLRALVDA